MSDRTPPELTPPDTPERDRRIIWTVVASLILHAGVLAFLLWPPLPDSAEAAPPPAIEVELVPPEISSSEPPPSSSEVPSSLEPPSDAVESSEAPSAQPSAESASSAEAPSAEPPSAPPSSAVASSAEPASSAEASRAASEAPASAAPSAAEVSASAASEPPPASRASAEVPPTPMSRRIVIPVGPSAEDSAAPSSAPDTGVAALTASTGDVVEGAPAASTEPDVAALDLGALHSAKRFYLEAMLSAPSMARAREVLKTLPREKRLSQTCNIEAIAQIGSGGRGLAPDVIIADAYTKTVTAGTRLTAAGAVFRSEKNWYGLAFDCTLSEDLTAVTAFSYRLGADVTEAVVARLGKRQ